MERVFRSGRKHDLSGYARRNERNKASVYQMTMEGQLWETDVKTLESKLLFDLVKGMKIAARPHFKGGYTGQGRVVVANNGFYKYGDDDAGLFESTANRGTASAANRTWSAPAARTWAT